MAKTPTATPIEIIRAAVALANKPSVDHFLYVGDLPPRTCSEGTAARKARGGGGPPARVIEAEGVPSPLPEYDLGRPEAQDRARGGIARGL
jgi:hypothetical protein